MLTSCRVILALYTRQRQRCATRLYGEYGGRSCTRTTPPTPPLVGPAGLGQHHRRGQQRSAVVRVVRVVLWRPCHDLRTPQVHSWSASSSSAFTFSIQAFIWGVSTSNSGSNESSSSRARARDARSTGGGHTGHELLRLHVPVQIVTQSKSHVVKKDKHEIEWNR